MYPCTQEDSRLCAPLANRVATGPLHSTSAVVPFSTSTSRAKPLSLLSPPRFSPICLRYGSRASIVKSNQQQHQSMHLYPHRASLQGLECEIFKLVSYAATPEQWREWLRVPLEHAAARGNLDLFNTLLGAGADGSAGWRGSRGRTLIDAAALGGSVDVVCTLLRAGAQPDVNVVPASSGRSALYTATFCGHEAVARRLIVAGADVSFQDPVSGISVLHEAILGEHEQLVNDLVISGANVNTRDEDEDDASPLHDAAYKGNDGMVSTLLLRGAHKDALDSFGETPLMWASRDGDLAVVKTLLAAGADFSIRSVEYDYSALDFAAENGHVDVLKAILGHGAGVNAHQDHRNGCTALHVAASHDQAGAVDALIEAGADIELKNYDGCTAVSSAAYDNYCKPLLTLLRRGATVTTRDNFGFTPLHQACAGQGGEDLDAAVDLLLRWGADETALTDEGESPADLLDVVNEDVDDLSTHEEIERTRLLLSRAPADRAWRRRCWLVIVRSRAEKTKTVLSCDSCGEIRDGPNASGGPPKAEGNKLVRRELKGSGVDHVVRRQASRGVGADGTDGECGVLSVVGAVLLVGLEPEGVFRTVVGFL